MKQLFIGLGLWTLLFLPVQGAVLNFSNSASISLNEPATVHTAPFPAVPYPSAITVSGVTDPVSKIRVRLNAINQPRPDDMEMLLVSPTGIKFVLHSDAGGSGTPAVNVNLILDDDAVDAIADAGPLVSGTFRPTCVDSANNIDTAFPASAPAGPYLKPAPRAMATLASAFVGSNLNGTWNLYAVDDSLNSPQTASISGGWSIEITTSVSQEATITALSSAPNPSFTTASSNVVVFTAVVTKQSGGAAVTNGNVTFREGATTLASNVALNGTGRAFYTNSTFTEGSHTITANYNGDTAFLQSSTNLTQTVDNHTFVVGNTFCNPGNIVFADAVAPGPANIYPSRIFVSGLSGTISKLTVQVKGLNHARADDIDLLLVSPTGVKFILMSDAGGTAGSPGSTTLTFDDAAASLLPDATSLATGTNRPSSFTGADVFPAPAPAGPYLTPAPEGGDTLAAFNGAVANGTWTLYIVDDTVNAGQINTITDGWCLTFVTSGDAATTTVLTSSVNPSFSGVPVTFTATVTSANAVTQGTVTFKEGAIILTAPIPLNGSGQARYTNSSLAEGQHTLTAQYNGSPGAFNTSSGNLLQEVNNLTLVNGNSFCNTGTVAFAEAGAPGVSTPYPSHVFVSGITGTVSKVTAQLKGLNHIRPDDIDVLLVGPTGSGLVLMSDAGGTTISASGVTLTFDDSAAALLLDDGGLATGTFRPTQHGAGDPFPAITPGSFGEPAPAGAATLASTFNNLNPNGTWSLYVVDDIANAGQGASIATGWCLNIVACVPATITAPASVCANASGNQASGPGGVSSYAWTIGNGTITSATNLQTISFTAGPIGNVALNLTVISATGCSTTNSVMVPIPLDNTPPTVTCPTNITVTATGYCPVTVVFSAGGSDNCGGVTVSAAPPSGSAFPVGTTPVKVTAIDTAGNTNTCSFNVTVQAGVTPKISLASVNTNVVLSWPSAFACYVLQVAPSLASSNAWTNYSGPLTTNAGTIYATNAASPGQRFYRLVY